MADDEGPSADALRQAFAREIFKRGLGTEVGTLRARWASEDGQTIHLQFEYAMEPELMKHTEELLEALVSRLLDQLRAEGRL